MTSPTLWPLNNSHLLFSFMSTIVLATWAPPADAIYNGYEPDESDTRFDAIAGLGAGRNLGLLPDGTSDHNWYCTVTLVAPNIIATARHCLEEAHQSNPPANYYGVRFRRNEEGGLGSIADGIESFYQDLVEEWIWSNAQADVALGRLSQPVPHIQPIPFGTAEALESLAGAHYIHGGWGKAGPDPLEGHYQTLKLCNNKLGIVSAHGDSMNFLRSAENNCWVTEGDSGSPIIFEDQLTGELRTFGVVRTTGAATGVGQIIGQAPISSRAFSRMDFVLSNVEYTAGRYERGGSIPISYELKNVGGSVASSRYNSKLNFYLSLNGLRDETKDISLGEVYLPSIRPGEAHSAVVEFPFPWQAPYGSYQLYARVTADILDAIDDNSVYGQGRAAIIHTPQPNPYVNFYAGSIYEYGATAGQILLYDRGPIYPGLAIASAESEWAQWNGDWSGRWYDEELQISGIRNLVIDGQPFNLDLSFNQGCFSMTNTSMAIYIAGDEVAEIGPVAHAPGLYYVENNRRFPGELNLLVQPSGHIELVVISNSGITYGTGHLQENLANFTSYEDSSIEFSGAIVYDKHKQNFVFLGQLNDGLASYEFEAVREGKPADQGEDCYDDRACQIGTGNPSAKCNKPSIRSNSTGVCTVSACIRNADCSQGQACVLDISTSEGRCVEEETPIHGDINRDGIVDGADLTAMYGQWGFRGTSICDLNNDGIVDSGDLTILLGNWS